MRKTPKKILGLLGLGLVAGMTVFAAVLPGSDASAVSTVTDSIVVTVSPPAYIANVEFLDHKDDVPYVNPNQNINVSYSGVEQIRATLDWTDENGNTTQYILVDEVVTPQNGTKTLTLNLANYGYGIFRLSFEGSGQYGAKSDTVAFSYVPVTAEVKEDTNGDINTYLDYDDNSADIDHFEIKIYDDNGQLVETLPAINKGIKKVRLPFENLPSGKYTVAVLALDATGNALYKSWNDIYVYDEPVIAVPNTGGLLGMLNISKADYLVTGLIVFAMVGGFGLFVILKKDKKKSTRKR